MADTINFTLLFTQASTGDNAVSWSDKLKSDVKAKLIILEF